MPAFLDGRCARCGKRYGWTGSCLDQPPCPKCGAVPDRAAAEANETEMDKFRKMLAVRSQNRKAREYGL